MNLTSFVFSSRVTEIFVCFVAIFSVSCSRQPQNSQTSQTVTISNVNPRLDVDGQTVDAHGGCLQFFGGRFYLYGTAFGTNRDYNAFNCPLVVYSSPDLQTWTFEGNLLKSPPDGVFYRPYVVFNPKTRKYVAWYNWYPKLWNGQAGVAVSENPAGPFTIVRPRAHLSGSRPGDGSLFVDDDGTGYYIYTDMAKDYAVRVERLTPDFLDSSGKISNVMSSETEAPVLFRRNDIYYALCGPLCAASPKGSEVQVFTSLSPLGPYSTQLSANINRLSSDSNLAASAIASSTNSDRNTATKPGGGNWFTFRPQASVPIIPAQQTWIAKFPAAGNWVYIWMGDRWGSNPDGLIAHDFQYWVPLDFTADGHILPLKNIARWYIGWSLNQ
jgi:hypothetical protein